ncbi:MAG: hypothetical protein JNK23_14795 [Opitutaceae bacterium]|nr:hypothetical protein [Opitutaceae bacterium]
MKRALRAWAWLAASAATVIAGRGGEPVPVMVQSAPGQFEISAVDSAAAHAVAVLAEDGWRRLAPPLELPSSFATPVYVRIISSAPEPFAVTAESGGVVSVRLDAQAQPAQVRRALVQGLLLRLAVAHHGVNERLAVPRWLEEACAGWWRTRADAAQLDALKQASEHERPPLLSAVLGWAHGGGPRPDLSAASVWLLTVLQTESGRGREWPALLGRLLRGDDPEVALGACYPGRFASPAERELWWQTCWHQAVRARPLPALSIADSRVQLGALARFVFAAGAEEADVVLPLPDVLARATEPIVAAELARRAGELSRVLATLHPFYRNAGLSLAEAFAARTAAPGKRAAAAATFARDWGDALLLEAASKAALDAAEKR